MGKVKFNSLNTLKSKGEISEKEKIIKQILDNGENALASYVNSRVKIKEDAKDICQDTFLRVINGFDNGKYEERGTSCAWVVANARLEVSKYFRDTQRKSTNYYSNLDDDIFEYAIDYDEENRENIMDSFLEGALDTVLARLPKEQEIVVRMRFFEGLKYKEISEMTDSSIATSLSRCRYARKKLAEMLINEERRLMKPPRKNRRRKN